jgi:hypothetical protein
MLIYRIPHFQYPFKLATLILWDEFIGIDTEFLRKYMLNNDRIYLHRGLSLELYRTVARSWVSNSREF